MAPSLQPIALESDPPSQADTPMTDANDELVTRIPVDGVDAPITVCITPSYHGGRSVVLTRKSWILLSVQNSY